MSESPYAAAARAWLDQDPDPDTQAELRRLLDTGDAAELAARFTGRLEFGTAGLRGELGAGPNRMNRVTVMRAAAGLAAWLNARHTDAAVVIGYDARHKSDLFARDTAAVLSGARIAAMVLPRPLPTPVLAYAVRHLGTQAGVMVTASHNPPRDNGYKVYVGDGSQIIPPVDGEISAAIDEVGRVDELPFGEEWQTLGDEVVSAYEEALSRLPLGDARHISVVYTPMHGVGRDVLLEAFEKVGFPAPRVVPEQGDPDPDFPTVAFPNPEEPGAMDLALELAARSGAELVLANDPDADRVAVAVGGRLLSGDEVGGLLAEQVLRHTSGEDRLLATTIVSSSLLRRIAGAHGVRYAETLTGFKWLARAGGPGDRLVYAYEEALGYCLGGDDGRPVHDKDGIGAALAVAALAADAKRTGRTLRDLLDEQAERYGLYATRPVSVRVTDLAEIDAVMRRLRAEPPVEVGGHKVLAAEDLAAKDTAAKDTAAGLDGLPPADVLRYRLDGEARLIVRPSGTEPKLKAYLEVVEHAPDGDVPAARRAAASRLDALEADLRTKLGEGIS